MCSDKQLEFLTDVIEAIENAQKWEPLYNVIKRQTGSEEEAREAIELIVRMEQEEDKYD